MSKVDSLKKRYIYKVFGNLVSVAAGGITQIIIPRALGPAQYGNFNFLTDFFTQFMSFLNTGTSTGFYTKISKRPKEEKLPTFYMGYVALATMITLFMVLCVCGFRLQLKLWPGQEIQYVYAAVIFASLVWFSASINDMVDAYGLTVGLEKSRFFQKIGGVFLIVFMLYQQKINIGSVFLYNYITCLIAILVCFYIARQGKHSITLQRLKAIDIRAYGVEFYQYSHPLLMCSFVSLATGLFDRWFLQVAGGGVEQGFYSLSYKIGALCFLLTSAMTQLITREYSIAYGKKDLGEIARLFRRHIPLLYGITALISCFVVVNADKATFILGGKKFHDAVLPVAIMAFYPIHQTYGQLSGSVFYATDQTRLYRNVAVFFMLVGIPVTYFLLASRAQDGMGLGAVGLALKMVVFNIVINIVLLYLNARFLRLSFGWYIAHQIFSVLVFLGVAWMVTFGVDHCLAGVGILGRFLWAGVGYFLIMLGFIYFFPYLMGLGRDDISTMISKMTNLKK